MPVIREREGLPCPLLAKFLKIVHELVSFIIPLMRISLGIFMYKY
jgi:hypothetical protein